MKELYFAIINTAKVSTAASNNINIRCFTYKMHRNSFCHKMYDFKPLSSSVQRN